MAAFEWDPEKATSNKRKHGVAFEEARSVFGDINALTFYDAEHSDDEDRYLTIGFADSGRLLVVSHTERDDTERDETTRIISARHTTRREESVYANERR